MTVGLAVLFALGRVEVWHVYVTLVRPRGGGDLPAPGRAGLISLMVPETHFARVQGFNQMLQGVLTIASPPLGRFSWVAAHAGVLAIDVVTALIGIVVAIVVAVPSHPGRLPGKRHREAVLLARPREGMAYIRAGREWWPS